MNTLKTTTAPTVKPLKFTTEQKQKALKELITKAKPQKLEYKDLSDFRQKYNIRPCTLDKWLNTIYSKEQVKPQTIKPKTRIIKPKPKQTPLKEGFNELEKLVFETYPKPFKAEDLTALKQRYDISQNKVDKWLKGIYKVAQHNLIQAFVKDYSTGFYTLVQLRTKYNLNRITATKIRISYFGTKSILTERILQMYTAKIPNYLIAIYLKTTQMNVGRIIRENTKAKKLQIPTKANQIKKLQILELYKNGLTCSEIQKSTSLPYKTIFEICKEQPTPKPTPKLNLRHKDNKNTVGGYL